MRNCYVKIAVKLYVKYIYLIVMKLNVYELLTSKSWYILHTGSNPNTKMANVGSEI